VSRAQGSLYAAFGDKDGLYRAALEHCRITFARPPCSTSTRGRTPDRRSVRCWPSGSGSPSNVAAGAACWSMPPASGCRTTRRPGGSCVTSGRPSGRPDRRAARGGGARRDLGAARPAHSRRVPRHLPQRAARLLEDHIRFLFMPAICISRSRKIAGGLMPPSGRHHPDRPRVLHRRRAAAQIHAPLGLGTRETSLRLANGPDSATATRELGAQAETVGREIASWATGALDRLLITGYRCPRAHQRPNSLRTSTASSKTSPLDAPETTAAEATGARRPRSYVGDMPLESRSVRSMRRSAASTPPTCRIWRRTDRWGPC
jgi:hypothetical protein